jgi:HD-GYP domain-containing protein (c-di-GMP phosphodiesterase class II)
MPVLIVRTPGGARREHRFSESATIGRGRGCDLVLEDPGVSSQHAVVVHDAVGQTFIRDLGSRNGTRVDGERGAIHWLADESEIRIGSTRLFFMMEADDATVPRIIPRAPGNAFTTDEVEIDLVDEPPDLGQDLLPLYQLAQLLHSVGSERDVVSALAHQVVASTGALRVAVLLRREAGQLERAFSVPRDPLALQAGTVSPGVLRAVLEERELLLVPLRRLGGGLLMSWGGAAAERLVLCVPIRSEERCHGMIVTTHLDPRSCFDDRQMRTAAAIGLQGGIALDNLAPHCGIRDVFLPVVTQLIGRLEEPVPYAAGHSQRVAAITVAVARMLPVGEAEIAPLELAALLHDVGGPGADDDVHKVAGGLTGLERARIRRHPVLGAELLSGLDGLGQVRAAIRHHHERWDGRGYPDGASGQAIPLWARLISVAEALDALTTDRSYRPGLSLQEGLWELQRCAGHQFDPAVVEATRLAYECECLPQPPRVALSNTG